MARNIGAAGVRGNATCNSGSGHSCTGRSLGTWILGFDPQRPWGLGCNLCRLASMDNTVASEEIWDQKRIRFSELQRHGGAPRGQHPGHRAYWPTCVHRRLCWNLMNRKTLTAATCQTVVCACWHIELHKLEGASRATKFTTGPAVHVAADCKIVAVRERLPRMLSVPQRKCCGTQIVSCCGNAWRTGERVVGLYAFDS